MVRIRLRRMGSRSKPFYRVVVSGSKRVPTARVLESLGYYDPRPTPPLVQLDLERADYWVARGARPSDTVRTLIHRAREAQA